MKEKVTDMKERMRNSKKSKWNLRREKEPRKLIFDEIMAKSFRKLLRDTNLPFPEGQQNPDRKNEKKHI